MMKIPLTVLLLATLVGLFLVDRTVVRRLSASSCFQQDGNARAEMRMGSYPMQTEGIGSRHPHDSVSLYCPIPSDSLLPHSNIDLVELHGWGSSLCEPTNHFLGSCAGFVVAYLCVSYDNSADGACTSLLRSELRGANYVIAFKGNDLWPWFYHPNGYPYIHVELPTPSWNGDTSTLRGITLTGRGGLHYAISKE
jgi:hypothetical protein